MSDTDKFVKCEECDGTGRPHDPCDTCHSWGWVDDPSDGGTMTCPDCLGESAEECPGCEGEGAVCDLGYPASYSDDD